MSKPRWVGATLLALALLASSASAQVKPKIMIIFDTSGSMVKDTWGNPYAGDGSPLCGGVGKPSRIYQLKSALFEVIQGMGAQEVDFALSTYPMMVDATRTPQCLTTCSFMGLPCSGHYYITSNQNWEFPPAGDGIHYACKVSTHNPSVHKSGNCSDASNPCAVWYNDYKKEVLKVPFGQPPENILWYFDQEEDSGPTLNNPEIRAAYSWFTPLGKSLFYSHGYFDKDVALPPSSYLKPCEKLVIAFFTDGGETCNVSPSDPFYPLVWAANLANNPKLKVVTHTIGIDIEASTQSFLEAIASAGKGTYYPVAGTTADLKKAFLDIVAKSQPPAELCNGKDDDCDNQIDEDFPQKGQPCNNGKFGVCFKTGTYVCKPDGSGVACNAPNATGTPEICDGLDNDCDGAVDEDMDPPCVNPICVPEICNGKDDDCDKQIDEDIPSSKCGKDIGICKAGMSACVNGKIVCQGGTGGTTEVCNGIDDDCDGAADGFSEACYTYESGCDLAAGTCKGLCMLGQRLCTAKQVDGSWTGEWGTCMGQVGPSAEICDGLDNDCDGTVDTGAECPGGGQCVSGACTLPCGESEFGCPVGQICKNKWCVPDTCDPVACDKANPGWVCRRGECMDACKSVTCDEGETCVKGACVDTTCYTKGCPAGQRCVNKECKPDSCAAVKCKDGEFCAAGSCVALCDSVNCNTGEICRVVPFGSSLKTECAKDPCAEMVCQDSQVCIDGKCVDDPCLSERCKKGEACVKGKCVADLCEIVSCPRGYQCVAGDCQAINVESTTDLLATGSGGVACNLGGEQSEGWLSMLCLGFILLGLSRRSRRN